MADFLATQLDFILFFYGLAFILFGAMCLGIARLRPVGGWSALAAFGLVHGVMEWLDLAALVAGDTPAYATTRIAILSFSFLCLIDYARLEAVSLGAKLPGRWSYLLLLLLVAGAWYQGGTTTAGIVARYAIGLPGAAAAGAIFLWRAKGFAGRKRWITAAGGFGLLAYALATGLVVPGAPFWPASAVNYAAFTAATGMPIQLVRGLLACWIALSIWAIWGRIAGIESGSQRYAEFLDRQFGWSLATLVLTLAAGWFLTQSLGNIYRADVEDEAEGDIAVLASRLGNESTTIAALASALAREPALFALVNGAGDTAAARLELDHAVEAGGARLGFLLDPSGRLLLASAGATAAEAHDFIASRAFADTLRGEAGYLLDFEPTTALRSITVSAPIRDAAGAVVGVIALQRGLERFEADLSQFDRAYFLVDPSGIVIVTNRPELAFRPLWAVSPDAVTLLTARYPQFTNAPILSHEISAAEWTSFEGARSLIRRSFAETGDWSIVMALPPSGRYASRILGIVITLLATLTALTYFFGRERLLHESIELERRLELQLIAQDLHSKAHTDALTGLFNRLRFDHGMAEEIARVERYRTPLALVIFDIDHFKRVNDSFGHQTGDDVLIRLARLATASTRSLDLLARWGGEEFVLLMPGCDLAAAKGVAEKLRAMVAAADFATAGRLTCSFGVAQFQHDDSAQSLIARADEALYAAKANGRNRVECAALRVAAE